MFNWFEVAFFGINSIYQQNKTKHKQKKDGKIARQSHLAKGLPGPNHMIAVDLVKKHIQNRSAHFIQMILYNIYRLFMKKIETNKCDYNLTNRAKRTAPTE